MEAVATTQDEVRASTKPNVIQVQQFESCDECREQQPRESDPVQACKHYTMSAVDLMRICRSVLPQCALSIRM